MAEICTFRFSRPLPDGPEALELDLEAELSTSVMIVSSPSRGRLMGYSLSAKPVAILLYTL